MINCEYLYCGNCKCTKKLVDKLVEECTENIEEVKLVENENKQRSSSCILSIVLFSLSFAINIGTGIHFVYSHRYLEKYDALLMVDTRTEPTNYRTFKWK